MKFATSVRLFGAATLASLILTPAAFADSGFYIGAAVGDTTISDDLGFDENDSSYKAMLGYIFDVPVVDFAVELAYNDFGAPSGDVLGSDVEFDAEGISAFGIVGMDWGLVGGFLKAGVVQWDVDVAVDNISAGSDDGTDAAYGVGLRFNFSSLELRAEYEIFDVADTDDVDMISLGVLWRF